MTELNEKFLSLEIADDIFKGIRYYITGEVHEKIDNLLKLGGAEHQNYFSDYVTHLIVGKNPEENDIADANDVYEIPAVTPRWIVMCASLKKLVDCKPYLFSIEPKLFSWQTFCFSKVAEDRNLLWGLITYNGGVVHAKLTKMCNFLVTGVTEGPKYSKADSLGPERIRIVTPDWVLEAVKTKSIPDPSLFHPKLINWPKPVKPAEPTTAITGFEPDTPDSREKLEEKAITDSTQALLEKLKQRMPWNQPVSSAPTTSSSSDPVAPPNVVAPSFLNKIQNNQEQISVQQTRPQILASQSPAVVSTFASMSTQSPSHVPRSTVHHTPNSQPNQQALLQQSPLNISRLIGQPQTTRPTSLQQLRGQLNTSQIHQQLLQQRIQQQNQQGIIQRTSSGQLNVNQQLLHQQLSQTQRQTIQNQLMSQQGLTSQAQVLSSLNQTQTSQSRLMDTQAQQTSMMGHQDQQFNQQTQLNTQQNQLNQQSQLAQSLSPNQIIRSPQQNQNQLLSPQMQNQLMSHQQTQQNQMNQMQQQQGQLIHQQANHFINQSQSQNQLSQQQERANQLLNQQQDRANQLLSQQERANQLLNQQERANQLLNQQQSQSQLNQQQNQSNQMLRQQQQSQNDLQSQLLGELSPQGQMMSPQQMQNQQQGQQQLIQQSQQLHQQSPVTQQSQQMIQQNQVSQQNQQQLIQQNQQNQTINQLNQTRVNQQSPILSQNQLVNQQGQQVMSRASQENLLNMSPNQHLSQLSPQQLQQLQQLKREQQQLINQNQMNQQNIGIIQQNVGLNQQNIINQGHNQLVNQNQQLLGQNQQMQINQQQLIQNRVIQQQNINQQVSQGQNFGQQGLNQHILTQKQLFGQQQINTSQHQQMIQNQQNQTNQQQQFVNQNQFDAIQQQKLNQGSGQGQMTQAISHMTVQALNQQLNTQNLGQQLNQQLLQQNQQTGPLNQQQGISIEQGMSQQNIGLINQQQQVTLNQQTLNLQGLQQGSNQQMNQMNTSMNQQVIRTQFPQQVLVSQGQQQGGPQRAQLNQQLWGQQQQPGGTPVQGQQIIRHPVNVAVQQSPTNAGVGPRVQWSPGQQPGVPQRQFIQLDAHTHNQLQKMPPDQQALFVAKLQQKQRQLQLAKQVQQRGGGHILIRGNVPPGLTAQQQVQWLQQQAKQQGIVLPPNIQQNLTPGTITAQPGAQPAPVPPHTPGLSPINQNAGPAQQFVGEQSPAQQLHLRHYRLQQLQLQREQTQKNAIGQGQGALPPQAVVRPPLGQQPMADSTTNPQVQVNPKTKTALANMLSIKLQSGGTIGTPTRPEGIPEPSAAGTLRMMTAQHNAAINSKPQEIIALQQRRVISGPNGEIIKTPVVPALPLTSQTEPPKLQYNQKQPIPVQHRVGPFYGHNPNLKLPPDLFLLGCIFVVVEVDEYLEKNLPGWQQKIEKYGGEVEKQYCTKVTHVLCETQRHGVVMQALRDLKRCVTIRWLSDVIKRKQVLPPWTALHLPQIYLDITPGSKHLISISGFEGNTRQIIKQMIQLTGAKCTTYFGKHNTLLICSKAEGQKFNHAKKWGIPVVNVQWLTDIILGNFSAMNQMDNQAYQTYSTPPNLSFDPKLVPNMMHAWKAPINISQESYERVKRSASPVSLPKAKKQKTEHTDENENITDEVPNPQYKILFTQFSAERLKALEKMVKDLGGTVTKDYKDFTHLIVPKLARTYKLLFAVVKSCHILSDTWLEECSNINSFLPESGFSLTPEEFNTAYNVNFEKTLYSSNRDKLFEGKTFWITPSVFPSKKILSELIESSGGKLERIRRSRAQIEVTNNTSPQSYFILIAQEDLHLVADLLKTKKEKQKVVCNVELVLSAILKQEFEIEPYLVSVV